MTAAWWSQLWLNEGFATFVEYIGAERSNPELRLQDQFISIAQANALYFDADADAQPVEDYNTVTGNFNQADYVSPQRRQRWQHDALAASLTVAVASVPVLRTRAGRCCACSRAYWARLCSCRACRTTSSSKQRSCSSLPPLCCAPSPPSRQRPPSPLLSVTDTAAVRCCALLLLSFSCAGTLTATRTARTCSRA